MIRKLQIKIIVIVSVLLTLIILGVLAAVNITNQQNTVQQINNRLDIIVNNDGRSSFDSISPYQDDSTAYVDFFTAQINAENQLTALTFNRDIEAGAEEIAEYINSAVSSGQQTGTLGRYAYTVRYKPYGRIVVFLDISQYRLQSRALLFTTAGIGILSVLIFILFSVALSFWLVKPVKDTLAKQKLFISNASHELKTPLAVIKANADVLETEIGDNKWLGYIQSESSRMSELVGELLCLARLDDKGAQNLVMEDTDLSELVMQSALPFESSMFEAGRKFEVDIQPGVTLRCDRSTIRHIMTILIDNAQKYSDEGGEVRVSLHTKGGKRIIEVYNTGMGISPDKLDKVFERFYREDEARNSSSGGYGLGLAIARSGAAAHGGTITAASEYGKWAKFTVTL